jgi:hypothetical protein
MSTPVLGTCQYVSYITYDGVKSIEKGVQVSQGHQVSLEEM